MVVTAEVHLLPAAVFEQPGPYLRQLVECCISVWSVIFIVHIQSKRTAFQSLAYLKFMNFACVCFTWQTDAPSVEAGAYECLELWRFINSWLKVPQVQPVAVRRECRQMLHPLKVTVWQSEVRECLLTEPECDMDRSR